LRRIEDSDARRSGASLHARKRANDANDVRMQYPPVDKTAPRRAAMPESRNGDFFVVGRVGLEAVIKTEIDLRQLLPAPDARVGQAGAGSGSACVDSGFFARSGKNLLDLTLTAIGPGQTCSA
jgi:hypothetical protein